MRICTSIKPPGRTDAAGLWPTPGVLFVQVNKMEEGEGRRQDDQSLEVGVGRVCASKSRDTELGVAGGKGSSWGGGENERAGRGQQ